MGMAILPLPAVGGPDRPDATRPREAPARPLPGIARAYHVAPAALGVVGTGTPPANERGRPGRDAGPGLVPAHGSSSSYSPLSIKLLTTSTALGASESSRHGRANLAAAAAMAAAAVSPAPRAFRRSPGP